MSRVLSIIKTPQATLRQVARGVQIKDLATPKIRRLISNMKETLKITPDGVGLAAPQIGESLRIFIISEEAEEIDKAEKAGWKRKREDDISEKNEKPYEMREWKYYVFINPTIKKMSKNKLDGAEGCLSVPGKFGSVKRHEKITVVAYDEHGKKFTRGASRFFSRVVQHELDHLDGTLFIDKAERIIESRSMTK